MNIFGTFMLFVSALVGSAFILLDPLKKEVEKLEGRTVAEVISEFGNGYSEDDRASWALKFCGLYLLALFFAGVVEPIAAITAILLNIGYAPLAYAMLFVILIYWIDVANSYAKYSGRPSGSEERIRLGSPRWKIAKKVFYALPTFYLWYLFLVVIHVL